MLLDIGNVDVSRVNGVIGSRLLMLKGIAVILFKGLTTIYDKFNYSFDR